MSFGDKSIRSGLLFVVMREQPGFHHIRVLFNNHFESCLSALLSSVELYYNALVGLIKSSLVNNLSQHFFKRLPIWLPCAG